MSTNLSNLSASRPPGVDSDGRTQLSNLYGVFVLSSLMFDGRGANAILELAANSVPSLSQQCHTDAAYRVVSGSLIDACDPNRELDGALDAIDLRHEVLAVLAQGSTFGGDIDGVEKFFHSASSPPSSTASIARARKPSADLAPAFGRHTSMSEQARQRSAR